MINRKNELLQYLESLQQDFKAASSVAPSLLQEQFSAFSEYHRSVTNTIASGELLVPVIGGFSAGKSSAINQLLGEDILPVAVTAETAIPAELRYSTSPHIIAVKTNGEEHQHDIAALASLSDHADDYEVVRVYLNNPVLQELEPFTLVDMPGYDSTLDQHNRAILRYLTRGAFYLYMVSYQDGTLNRQHLARLHEIRDNGHNFAVFMSKKDLSAPIELEEVMLHIKDQVALEFGNDVDVASISMNDVAPLKQAVLSANPNALFDNQYKGRVKELFYRAQGDLNAAINALKTSKEDGLSNVEQLQQALADMEKERDKNLEEVQAGSLTDAESRIASRIERDLTSAAGELARVAKTSEDALSRAVSDRVRSALVVEMRTEVSRVSTDIARNFADKVSLSLPNDFHPTSDWLDTLTHDLQGQVMDALTGGLTNPAGSGSPDATTGKPTTGKTIGASLGALALMIPHPVIKVILAILPGIIGHLFDNFSASQADKKYEAAITGQVIPSVMSQLRPQIREALMQVSDSLTTAISQEFEAKIQRQQDIYHKAQQEHERQADEIEHDLAKLSELRDSLNNQAEKVIV
ncbi:MAG: dynamin family protein [Firmicutes bacterium]|nr:dynamin family protein [Bacillota bacterium]